MVEDARKLAAILQEAEAYVRNYFAAHAVDSSHDWWHIQRVRQVSLMLADAYSTQTNDAMWQKEYVHVVELCALLHDVEDWKYSGSEAAAHEAVSNFLTSVDATPWLRSVVLYVIQHIGFKESLQQEALPTPPYEAARPILHIVQDADRLDAIGAVGVARCLTFGGRFNRVLHNPSARSRANHELDKSAYMKMRSQTTVNHFYEKLLKLEGLMNTDAGKAAAQERSRRLRCFLEQFLEEWDGDDVRRCITLPL